MLSLFGKGKALIKHTHRHGQKIDVNQLVESVQKMSKARGERMTDVRRDVIVVMSKLQKPQSAYKILAEVNKKRVPQLSAMSIYRTLDFLIELGIVVKYDSQNVYKLCTGHNHDHSHLLMICNHCGNMKEVEDCSAEQKLQNIAQKYGHTLKHNVIELRGLCAKCAA